MNQWSVTGATQTELRITSAWRTKLVKLTTYRPLGQRAYNLKSFPLADRGQSYLLAPTCLATFKSSQVVLKIQWSQSASKTP